MASRQCAEEMPTAARVRAPTRTFFGPSRDQKSHFTVMDLPRDNAIVIIQEAPRGGTQLYAADQLRENWHYGVRATLLELEAAVTVLSCLVY